MINATVLASAIAMPCPSLIIGVSDMATYEYLSRSFDRLRPGFGIETTKNGPMDLPMAYGLVAKAAAMVHDEPMAVTAANWLVENSETSKGIGWGLGWSWDAFTNGSPNPPDTIYGITTAIAIDGLLETYRITGAAAYLDKAIEALDSYSQFRTKTEAGHFFWYSNQSSDAKNVHNVSAMLTGMFATAGLIGERPKFLQLAKSALAELVAAAHGGAGEISWSYADVKKQRPNDVLHASYIAYGASLAMTSLNVDWIDQDALLAYLRGYLSDEGKPMEFRSKEAGDRMGLRARSWGAGMLAFAFFHLRDVEAANAVLSCLEEYEFAPGKFSYRFGDRINAKRGTAHVLLAVAAAEVINMNPH